MSEQSSRRVSIFCRSKGTGVDVGRDVRSSGGLEVCSETTDCVALSGITDDTSVERGIVPRIGDVQAVRKN